jgi:chemotaxis protein MotB
MDIPRITPSGDRHYAAIFLSEHAEPDTAEEKESGWLISFVDILTLLLTLFVLLLAFNHISQRKTSHHTPTPAAAPRAADVPNTAAPQPPSRQLVHAPAKPLPIFAIPKDIKDKVDIVATSTEMDLVIKDDVLFDEGSPNLKTLGESVLARVAQLLAQNPYPISVEGHTDNIPIHTAQFPSNWELSTLRATTVTRYFIDHGIAVARLRAIGYADTRPIADNGNEAGRARNRRVSLVVHLNEPAANAQNDTAGKPDEARH